MGTIKSNGIIICENNLGDYDKMLTMLTPGFGKISCVAKGARRQKSALLGGTQFLCFGEYLMYKGSNTYNINSCETIEVFYNLRTDLDKLNYAVEMAKIIRDVTEENQNCFKIIQLLLNTLYTLSETDKEPQLIMSIFKLKLLCFLGFTPRIENCVNCKQKEKVQYFSLKDNGLKCESCAKQDKSCLEMTESTANAIKYIIMAPAKKLYSFNLKDESLKELVLITKLYFDEKMEI
ncbi:MAG: DNA repair protein RecO [Clostridia bacterium]|jgi:DNA repair protein RecO (recombination protein O)|nr:DNA repair protein RecO [Clostridia bacterium]